MGKLVIPSQSHHFDAELCKQFASLDPSNLRIQICSAKLIIQELGFMPIDPNSAS